MGVAVNRVGDEFIDGVEKLGQYAVLVDDTPVPILSLSLGAFEKIQVRTGLRWSRIIMDPLERIDVAADLVRAAFDKAGKPAPNLDESKDWARLIVEMPADVPELPDVRGKENPTTAS